MCFSKIQVYKTPPQMYFGTSWSSDILALNSSIFEESNVINCNMIYLGCFNTYWLPAGFDLVIISQSPYIII